MSAADYIRLAVAMIKGQPSPYQRALIVQLQQLEQAARMHESCQGISDVTNARAPTLTSASTALQTPDVAFTELEASG